MSALSRPTSHTALSPESWADLIRSRVASPHMAAWAASILAWDFGDSAAFAVFGPIMERYDKMRSATDKTEDIVETLRLIGYRAPEARCVLRQDLVHAHRRGWGHARPRGVR